MSNNDFLVLKNITKSFGKSTVIDNLDLTIKRGTMVTLLGPSGCGKTTVLRLVAGLENPTSGQIFIDGEDVTKSSIQNRDICIVFQSYALFPHMSIGDNVGYGLRMQGVSKEERTKRVKEALELVDLAGFEDRFVDQISGGQQQRVALARALVLKPALLSALVTSFVRAMTTVSAIIFLVTADTRVATAYILNRVEDGEYGVAIAYGSILIIVMMAIILFFDWIVGDTRISRSKAKKMN